MTKAKKAKARTRPVSLADLGIFGYEHVESVIFASLVSGDPLLLIGSCGTGKTQLLNSLSDALGLDHRHYNASLISFDDLVGFPFPDKDNREVDYLRTPATVWDAESVLIDEISRCKPEHQNRLFSVIQEKKVQGLPLTKLIYRWAAMNPFSNDQSTSDVYLGSEPLDQALADRFAFILNVPDWDEFTKEVQLRILNSADVVVTDSVREEFRSALDEWRRQFERNLARIPEGIYEYCRLVTNEFRDAETRLSPRRARQLVRNIVAIATVNGSFDENDFKLALQWSLPHRAFGLCPIQQTIEAIHKTVWEVTLLTGPDRWLAEFHHERDLSKKLALLVEHAPDTDTGSLAVTQLLALESKERAAAFAFATYPAAVEGTLPIGAEAINDIGVIANEVMHVDKKARVKQAYWQPSRESPKNTIQKVLLRLKEDRKKRAEQLFTYLLSIDSVPADAEKLEEEIESCVQYLSTARK
jgi:MoxR-like ATPase